MQTSPGAVSSVLSRLSRITTAGRKFIPQIDGLRFLAIMSVIAYHVQGIALYHFGITSSGEATAQAGLINKAFGAGHYGVQLFFAISGFILSLPFAKQYLSHEGSVSLREYYARRVARIEPPYVIHVCILFLLACFVYRHLPSHPQLYHNPAWASYLAPHILATLFYVHGFVFGTQPYPNIVLWSLAIEVQFYILAPFLAKVFLIRKASLRRLLLTGLILLFAIANAIKNRHVLSPFLTGYLHFFFVGFLVADLYTGQTVIVGSRSFAWDIALLVTLGAVFQYSDTFFIEVLMPGAAFLCFLSAFRGVVGGVFFGNALISTIGGMCYTIYMYHLLLISLFFKLTGKLQTHVLWLDEVLQFVLLSAVIIGIGAVLFAFTERPFMRRNWPSKAWAVIRRRPAQSAS